MRRGVTVPWPDAAQCQCGMTTPHPEAGARSADRPLRVLHVPGATGGHPQGLARAERELGLDSRSIVFEASPFGYEADRGRARARPVASRSRAARGVPLPPARARAAGCYDVVHYNFGQSLFPRPIVPGSPAVAGFPRRVQQVYRGWSALLGMRDLALLRRRGVALFRQRSRATTSDRPMSAAHASRGRRRASSSPTRSKRGMDRARRTVARRFDRSPTASTTSIPTWPTCCHPRSRFVAYAHVDPREWRPESRPPNRAPARRPRADRANDQGARTTCSRRLDALRAEGVEFDLELVEGRTQAEAAAGLRPRRPARRPAACSAGTAGSRSSAWHSASR